MTLNEAAQILGVSISATADEVKKAHQKLARLYHPDRQSVDLKELAESKLKEINLASDRFKKFHDDGLPDERCFHAGPSSESQGYENTAYEDDEFGETEYEYDEDIHSANEERYYKSSASEEHQAPHLDPSKARQQEAPIANEPNIPNTNVRADTSLNAVGFVVAVLSIFGVVIWIVGGNSERTPIEGLTANEVAVANLSDNQKHSERVETAHKFNAPKTAEMIPPQVAEKEKTLNSEHSDDRGHQREEHLVTTTTDLSGVWRATSGDKLQLIQDDSVLSVTVLESDSISIGTGRLMLIKDGEWVGQLAATFKADSSGRMRKSRMEMRRINANEIDAAADVVRWNGIGVEVNRDRVRFRLTRSGQDDKKTRAF